MSLRATEPVDAAPELSAPDVLTLARLAAEEGIDRRTLLRRFNGEPVRGVAGARADRAIAKFRASEARAARSSQPK